MLDPTAGPELGFGGLSLATAALQEQNMTLRHRDLTLPLDLRFRSATVRARKVMVTGDT